MPDDIAIRRATAGDISRIASMAAKLVRMHHDTDPARFFLPPNVESGYAWWLGRERERDGAVVLVAESNGAIEGYSYGTLEERDWNLLIDAHGAIHDVFVDDGARRHGVGRRLVSGMIEALESLGATQILLSTMVGNLAAQGLFAAMDFRPTMLEMTRSKP